jgi:hypothetical protein
VRVWDLGTVRVMVAGPFVGLGEIVISGELLEISGTVTILL